MTDGLAALIAPSSVRRAEIGCRELVKCRDASCNGEVPVFTLRGNWITEISSLNFSRSNLTSSGQNHFRPECGVTNQLPSFEEKESGATSRV